MSFVTLSKPMMDVCSVLVEICKDMTQNLPNAKTDLSNPESVVYSIDYALGIVQMTLLKAISVDGVCPEPIISSMHTLLLKAVTDLKEKIGIEDPNSTEFAMYLSLDTVKTYVEKYMVTH